MAPASPFVLMCCLYAQPLAEVVTMSGLFIDFYLVNNIWKQDLDEDKEEEKEETTEPPQPKGHDLALEDLSVLETGFDFTTGLPRK